MPTISITSPGLIDLNALRLMGASTKRGDSSKIGRFGSGLKYSLAYFLRNGYEVKLFRGTEEVKISLEPTKLRDIEYKVIQIAGVSTSITTELGPDWSLWQAVRELVCNALDEGAKSPLQYHADIFGAPEPSYHNSTIFLISGPGLADFWSERFKYFANPEALLETTPHGSIYRRAVANSRLFRQGILVHEFSCPLAFDYDIPQIELNEERAPKHDWQTMEALARLQFSSTKPEIISAIASFSNKDLAGYADWHSVDLAAASLEWRTFLAATPLFTQEHIEVLSKSSMASGRLVAPFLFKKATDAGLAKALVRSSPKSAYIPATLEPHQEAMLISALKTMATCHMACQYSITLVRFVSPTIYAIADTETKTIHLSPICFTRGEQFLLSTLMEEWIHLQHAVADETRPMQDAILEQLAGLALKYEALTTKENLS